MAEPVLAAEDVTVEQDGATILDDISLEVPADRRVLVRGESGAGKTTLFHVLGLLDTPTAGRVLVSGTDTSGLSERRRARLRRDTIGIVFQEFRLIPDLTARENAAVPQRHRGEPDREWLGTLFERLSIADLADQYPATLSGGEKQRVAIARALANRPAVVLADEPTGQLDPETTATVVDLLFEVQATAEAALVVISHDTQLAPRFETAYELAGRHLEPVAAQS